GVRRLLAGGNETRTASPSRERVGLSGGNGKVPQRRKGQSYRRLPLRGDRRFESRFLQRRDRSETAAVLNHLRNHVSCLRDFLDQFGLVHLGLPALALLL